MAVPLLGRAPHPPRQPLASSGSLTWQTQSGRGCLPSAEACMCYLNPHTRTSHAHLLTTRMLPAAWTAGGLLRVTAGPSSRVRVDTALGGT